MNPRPPKPIALQVLAEHIPAGMRARRQWVVWKYELKSAETKPWTKVPYNPNQGYKASHSKPSTWGTFEKALIRYQRGGYDGIGYVFSKDDPCCGIDLDECRTPEDGTIVPEKRRYVDQMTSYTEVSPSGMGLHIIIEGQLPGGGRKNAKLRIEVYDRERFFCFTGHTLNGMPAEPQPRQDELEKFYAEIFGPKKTQAENCFESDTSPLTADEQKILDKALANKNNGEKIRLLFDGKFKEAGFPSQSEADLALCNYLTFWFNRDPKAIDKVFRTSLLYRPKWDEKHFGNGETYGQHTIKIALETVSEGYSDTIRNKTTQSPNFDGEPYDIFGEPALIGRPEWPANACPRAIDAFARDEAERIGVDIAMVALPAIGITAIAISDQFKIQPKRLDHTWTEDPRLWLAVVGDPGQKKTPALNSAKRPLDKVAFKLQQEHETAMAQYNDEYNQWEDNKKRGTPPKKPVQKRLYVDDTTVEALRGVLGDNPRGVGIIKDELSGWLTSFDAYRNANTKGGSKDRADFCELYQGGPKNFDRVEKGHMFTPHWGASIVGGIQPGPVARMMGNITDDGLVARFLVAHCERSGNGAERAPNMMAIGTYEDVIKALADLKPRNEVEIFVFSEQAVKYRFAVRDLAQAILVLPDTSDALKAHMNKWEAAFCRLALVYHLIEETAAGKYPDREIPEQTAKMAATLMTEFLLPNSIRFYTETIDDGSQSKHKSWVAGYILSEGLQTIKRRDLQRIHKPFANNPKLLSATMAALYVANWVEEETIKRDGTVTAWAINPKVHSKFSHLVMAEQERRAVERAKVQQAVERVRRSRGN